MSSVAIGPITHFFIFLQKGDNMILTDIKRREDIPVGLDVVGLDLQSKTIGALPIINHFFDRLNLLGLFKRHLPRQSKETLSQAESLIILSKNILMNREPVYGIGEWASLYDPKLIGLGDRHADILNDDRIGRGLDALFLADRSTMMTEVVLHAIKEFSIDLKQLHNDSTTVTVTGEYKSSPKLKGKESIALKHGKSKDHRPDLKQLLFSLTVSSDGATPVHYKTYDGNVTDDTTHIHTWESLRRLTGHVNFTYVADCKLCTRDQMDHIQREHGRFITVMPRTRKEDIAFRQQLRIGTLIEWTELLRKKTSVSKTVEEDVYYGFESPTPSSEGYRILWIKSSQKQGFDEHCRKHKIQKTITQLLDLKDKRVGRKNLKTKSQIEDAVTKIFHKNDSAKWFDWRMVSQETEIFKQIGKGRPSENTKYERKIIQTWTFTALPAYDRIREAAADDGIFPMITNHPSAEKSSAEILSIYKYQPFIEKRHQQFKTVLEAAPVYLKLPYRIEALMFIYFIALLVNALIERELRRSMKANKVRSMSLYPEARPCEKPTTDLVLSIFSVQQRHVLKLNESEIKTFFSKLSPLQESVLAMLGVSSAPYLS